MCCLLWKMQLRYIVCLSLAILYSILVVYALHSGGENIAKQESPPDVKPLNSNKTRVKVLLVAYGRTGSSLAGELLSLDKTTAYFFEPFYKWVLLRFLNFQYCLGRGWGMS